MVIRSHNVQCQLYMLHELYFTLTIIKLEKNIKQTIVFYIIPSFCVDFGSLKRRIHRIYTQLIEVIKIKTQLRTGSHAPEHG